MGDSNRYGEGCSCDPAVTTSDCNEDPCSIFMGFFLVLECFVLICYVTTIFVVESRAYSTRGRKKSNLWRVILPACCVGCLAKVLRLGILANPETRHKAGQVVLLLLFNTHLCCCTIGFITLLFFWMRLKHDLAVHSNNKMFGKLLPGLSIIITVVFYYAQVVVKALTDSNFLIFAFLMINGLVSFVISATFVGYSVSVWRSFEFDKKSLFYKTFVSSVISSTLIMAFCIQLLISNTTSFNTTTQYLIKHAIYETIYFAELVVIPSGFIIHYYTHYVSQKERSISEMSLNSISNSAQSPTNSISRSLSSNFSLSASSSSINVSIPT